MKAKIICENREYGSHDFYLLCGQEKFFLFRQKYRSSVENHFKSGVTIEDAIHPSHANRNFGLIHTMEKIIPWVEYIEKEKGIMVLNKTIQKRSLNNHVA